MKLAAFIRLLLTHRLVSIPNKESFFSDFGKCIVPHLVCWDAGVQVLPLSDEPEPSSVVRANQKVERLATPIVERQRCFKHSFYVQVTLGDSCQDAKLVVHRVEQLEQRYDLVDLGILEVFLQDAYSCNQLGNFADVLSKKHLGML